MRNIKNLSRVIKIGICSNSSRIFQPSNLSILLSRQTTFWNFILSLISSTTIYYRYLLFKNTALCEKGYIVTHFIVLGLLSQSDMIFLSSTLYLRLKSPFVYLLYNMLYPRLSVGWLTNPGNELKHTSGYEFLKTAKVYERISALDIDCWKNFTKYTHLGRMRGKGGVSSTSVIAKSISPSYFLCAFSLDSGVILALC